MTGRALHTVLVANRGEIALRIMRTCRERGVRTVAVYSEADTGSLHVRAADEARFLGGSRPAESYLNIERILAAARSAGADAIHPGYGFLSENAAFAEEVARAGMIFIGPPPSVLRLMGDKSSARRLMAAAGVPVLPGSGEPLATVEEARSIGRTLGYPVLLKAAAGGGGRGLRRVETEEELGGAFRTAASEALSAFGDGRLYIEKFVAHPRHVEVQVLADTFGNVVQLAERECSIQRRHQKLVEESPSPALTPSQREAILATGVRVARACGYVNAGTVEFLLDEKGDFHFLEMNTRLQVEHPVTELRTGLDLVALQLQVAAGNPLPFTQEEIVPRGHAIECRICAEDAAFMPSTGILTELRPAGGPGVRDDRGVEQGSVVSVFYDSLLAKLCVWAPDRDGALQRMARALDEYVVHGVETNLDLLRYVIAHPAFRQGKFSTRFLEEHAPDPAASLQGEGEEVIAAVAALAQDAAMATPARRRAGTRPGNGWRQGRLDGLR